MNSSLPGTLVKISHPSSPTPMVCSNCADSLPSAVTTVQPSFSSVVCLVPSLAMGSMVKNIPTLSSAPSAGQLPPCSMCGGAWNLRPMPCAVYLVTTLKPAFSMCFCRGYTMAPMRPLGLHALSPISSASRVTRTNLAATSLAAPAPPTMNVLLVSPCQPSTTGVTSMFTMSPRFSTVASLGMPWHTTSLTEMQLECLKPRYPRVAGTAPGCEVMNWWMSSSSCAVVAPATTCGSTCASVRAASCPARCIPAKSAGLCAMTCMRSQ
mmetsp:Transcript_12288/g.29691  ORF Transcript_12288/g.29691 Transcript_12288/m.29691 type:complete len:266 (-) Transcript_12288:258-1055(-)